MQHRPTDDGHLLDLRASTRRQFLAGTGVGLGAALLPTLVGADEQASNPLAPRVPTRPARAKHVIVLHMAGSPPQQDLFDRKPELQKRDGEPAPLELFEGKRLAFTKGHPKLLASPHGAIPTSLDGLEVCELMPHFAQVADRTCVVRSMVTDEFNHAPAQLLMYTGSPRFGAASMGSWLTWGLGSLAQDLPGFVVMVSGGTDPSGGKNLWSSGFLPSAYQGVQVRGRGDPILYVSDPSGMSRATRRRSLDALRELNQLELAESRDPETLARIQQAELAFRMQTAVPDVMDIVLEGEATLEAYGAQPGKASFANNCLLARRLVERGVRYVQLYDWGWDVHGTNPGDDLATQFPMKCREVDRPVAALLLDLERRGLLDETLVVWTGEFGRTSFLEARNGSTLPGRDHHPDAYSIWLAGGGVKRGAVVGETDDFATHVVRDQVHVRDLQATILHLCGLEADRLRYPYQGLEQRLIGPAQGPSVRTQLLA